MSGLNLQSIMPYPGRLIIIGATSAADKVIVAYAVTGRSASSQARRLTFEASSVWTEPLEESRIDKGNVDLLIYRAIAIDRMIAVSNGRQTDDVARALKKAGQKGRPEEILARALKSWTYEPDSPHFTPRISGCVLTGGAAGLCLIRRGEDGTRLVSSCSWELDPGQGRMIATYSGREDSPLPSFSGEPVAIEVKSATARDMAEALYQALKPAVPEKDYRVAVACISALRVNLRNFDVEIINRREG
jgi:phosphoribosylglycinamide formyltransferase-1